VAMGLVGAARGSGKITEFDRIRVHRIDVVEPDGTPRLIIADRTEYPGSFYHGREIDRPDRGTFYREHRSTEPQTKSAIPTVGR
jgi:hypothetical protein